ncbi:MAG: biotin transporter BioY [Phycisphaeraceae bacterium]|nr:biotin transporter BioY [Phycisphaeraceae bacterium]
MIPTDPNTATAASPAATILSTPAARRLGAVLFFAVLTAAAAQVAIPVPGSPVPITLQTLAVVLCGLALGPRLGAASMGVYLLAGLAGLPVFADLSGGAQVFAGATVGYLLGFAAAPMVMGAVIGSAPRAGTGRIALGVVAAHATIHLLGLAGLVAVAGMSLADAAAMMVWPYAVGDVLKAALAIAVGARLIAWRQRLN